MIRGFVEHHEDVHAPSSGEMKLTEILNGCDHNNRLCISNLREANRRPLFGDPSNECEAEKVPAMCTISRDDASVGRSLLKPVRCLLQERVTRVTASSRVVTERGMRSGYPQVRGGKAHAHRECNTKYYMERNHLRRCQHVRYARAENPGGQDDMHSHRHGGYQERGCSEPQSTHSACESCEKQPPPDTQRNLRENANDSHY
jgi:hypothetical protein